MFGRRCVFAPLAALLLLGCQPSPPSAQPAVGRAESSAAAAPTSQPLALVPISVAYAAVTPTVAPVWVAAELGFGQQYGLDISPLATKTAPILQAALASGDVQYGQDGTAGQHDGARLAAATWSSSPRPRIAPPPTWSPRPTITTPDALRGKTLGVQSIGGTVYFRALLGLAPPRTGPRPRRHHDRPVGRRPRPRPRRCSRAPSTVRRWPTPDRAGQGAGLPRLGPRRR